MIFKKFVVHEKVELLECPECYAMIADDIAARSRHEKWHNQIHTELYHARYGGRIAV